MLAYLEWYFYDKEKRKPFDEFKSGLIEHEHNYTIPTMFAGVEAKKCNHYGCNVCKINNLDYFLK